jgi:competence ComEA-like helix-hairpin-helix protein
MEYRTANGPFWDVEQLRRVKGIGKKKFEQIRVHVAVLRPGATKPSRKAA